MIVAMYGHVDTFLFFLKDAASYFGDILGSYRTPFSESRGFVEGNWPACAFCRSLSDDSASTKESKGSKGCYHTSRMEGQALEITVDLIRQHHGHREC
jgi:hypothetical protein